MFFVPYKIPKRVPYRVQYDEPAQNTIGGKLDFGEKSLEHKRGGFIKTMQTSSFDKNRIRQAAYESIYSQKKSYSGGLTNITLGDILQSTLSKIGISKYLFSGGGINDLKKITRYLEKTVNRSIL